MRRVERFGKWVRGDSCISVLYLEYVCSLSSDESNEILFSDILCICPLDELVP